MPTVNVSDRTAYFPTGLGEVTVLTDAKVPDGRSYRVITRLVGVVTECRKGGPWRVSTPDGRDLGEFFSRPEAARALIEATGDDAAALPDDIDRAKREAAADAERRDAEERRHAAAVADAHRRYDRSPGMPDLPLPMPPEQYGYWPRDFTELVDAYARAHGITLTETFRRISEITGNSANGIALRYRR